MEVLVMGYESAKNFVSICYVTKKAITQINLSHTVIMLYTNLKESSYCSTRVTILKESVY